jgi:hypothetical protein
VKTTLAAARAQQLADHGAGNKPKSQQQLWWDVTEQRDGGNLNMTTRTTSTPTPAPANEGQRWQQQPWWWSAAVKQSNKDDQSGLFNCFGSGRHQKRIRILKFECL